MPGKFLAKVVRVYPRDNAVDAEELFQNFPKVFSVVPVLKHVGMPNVNDWVVIDNSIKNYPYVSGIYPKLRTTQEEEIFATGDDIPAYSSVSYGEPLYSSGGDKGEYNSLYKMFYGFVGRFMALYAGQIAKILMDSINGHIAISADTIDIQTSAGVLSFVRDDKYAGLILKCKTVLKDETEDVAIKIGKFGESDIIRVIVGNGSNDILLDVDIESNGDVNVRTNSISAQGENVAAVLKNLLIQLEQNLNIYCSGVNVEAQEVNIQSERGLDIKSGSNVNISAANDMNINTGILNVSVNGSKVPLPIVPASTVQVSNGSLDFVVGAPLTDSPTSVTSVNFLVGLPPATRPVGPPYRFSVFTLTPGGIILGGPPMGVGINSFVKYNEFITWHTLLTALLGQIAAFFATLIADPTFQSTGVSGAGLGVLGGLSATVTASIAALQPAAILSRSVYVTTAEP
jgi:hypothetical protein